jgi:hypothetical protein
VSAGSAGAVTVVVEPSVVLVVGPEDELVVSIEAVVQDPMMRAVATKAPVERVPRIR